MSNERIIECIENVDRDGVRTIWVRARVFPHQCWFFGRHTAWGYAIEVAFVDPRANVDAAWWKRKRRRGFATSLDAEREAHRALDMYDAQYFNCGNRTQGYVVRERSERDPGSTPAPPPKKGERS